MQADTLDALEPVRQRGQLADVYLQFANSEPALQAYLHMEQALKQGSLDTREIEAIKLRVSQLTACDYCLSVHTFKAGQAGFDADTIRRLRAGESIAEPRIDVLLQLVDQLLLRAGTVPSDLLDRARACSLSDRNLVDLTMAISTIHFTNLTNHLNDSRSSLPPAPPLED